MLLRRCTQGICLISLLLISCAFILDDMAILFAGCSLIMGILGQYLIFDHHFREIVTSVKVQRSLSRNPVRKGTVVQVAATITFRGSSRMHVQIADQLPINTILEDGETSVTTRPDPSWQTCLCNYRIIPLIHGSMHFSGISVTIRNLFFEDRIQLTRESDREPVLLILPTGLFAAPASELADGTRDSRKASVWTGSDVHSLREYYIGDNLAHVDWKISAKYDKIFIRKYTGLMSHPPLVIVDLPWREVPYPENEFNRMISEVTGMVRHTLQTYQYVSVLLISGPNILHLIREEKNVSRCMTELREWMHPAERMVHFYHMTDRSDIRSRLRTSENALMQTTDSAALVFFEHLRDRYTHTIQYQRLPAFSGQVARTLFQLVMTE
ncbi:MAG: DUF58 domain-containing protein, partial [Methanoregula sp.]|nr:DUF58 domain-containing protein [Methanoregula sp.]